MLGRSLVIAWKELMLFGYAINTDVRHMPTIVFDQDQTAASRALGERMRATGFYDLLGNVRGYDEIERALRQGTAKVALVIPPRFGSALASGHAARVQLIVDGSDPQTVASATNTAASLVQSDATGLVVKRLGPAAGELLGLEVNTWYNPEVRTAVYVVPGLVGVILTMTMVMLTAMAIARERERGTLEQLIVSPIRSVELVVGKILPFIVIGYVQMSLILTAGYMIFHVPVAGSLVLLYLLAFVFIAANLAIGLVFSTVAKTQQQAMQMSFFFLLPNILLSGFMFPFEGMPRGAQLLSTALPLTHFLRIVRAIVLKGGGFADVRAELVWLTGILLALVTIASARFQKKLG
jgi:ABC-2 type transport system permease protein